MGDLSEEIGLILLDLKLYESFAAEARRILSDDERARADRFKVREVSERFLLVRGLLRRILGGISDQDPSSLRFSYGPHGKSVLEGSDLAFNLSHSGDWAAIAVTRGRGVGVDLERIRAHDEGLAERYFSAPEAILCRVTPPEERDVAFFHFWTAKEAYLKARGEGIAGGLKTHSFSDPWEDPPRLTWVKEDEAEPSRWTFFRFWPAADVIGTLAYAGSPAMIREIRSL